jgi:DNA-binding beta-propeller fold protein YncE
VALGAVVAALAVTAIVLTLDGEPASRAATGPTPTPTATPRPPVPEVADTIRNIGSRPTGIAYSRGDLWVTSSRSAFLTRIDAARGKERQEHPPVGRRAAAVGGDGRYVWVTSAQQRRLIRLSARTGAVRGRTPIPGVPRRMAVNDDGVWVATEAEGLTPGRVWRYSPRTGRLLGSIPVPEGIGAIAAAPDGVFIVKHATERLARLNEGKDAFVDLVAATGKVSSMRYGGGALWLVLPEEDTIARYGMDGRPVHTAGAGNRPTTAVFAQNLVFVAARDDQAVLVLDPETLRPAAEPIPVGLNPIGLATDGRSVWVTTLDNAVTRIRVR